MFFQLCGILEAAVAVSAAVDLFREATEEATEAEAGVDRSEARAAVTRETVPSVARGRTTAVTTPTSRATAPRKPPASATVVATRVPLKVNVSMILRLKTEIRVSKKGE